MRTSNLGGSFLSGTVVQIHRLQLVNFDVFVIKVHLQRAFSNMEIRLGRAQRSGTLFLPTTGHVFLATAGVQPALQTIMRKV